MTGYLWLARGHLPVDVREEKVYNDLWIGYREGNQPLKIHPLTTLKVGQ